MTAIGSCQLGTERGKKRPQTGPNGNFNQVSSSDEASERSKTEVTTPLESTEWQVPTEPIPACVTASTSQPDP